ncbi:UNVERIFIED_CONTAM: hypothetical protein Slati_2711600 [Sesamum latifolium]|uniref:Uncharacterized protein n=1 Tax=Sesamum latifolium TaxID=2727402 RepID=A0AAW2VX88_9LAMI
MRTEEGTFPHYNIRRAECQEGDSQRKEYKKKGSPEEGASLDNALAKGVIHRIAGGPLMEIQGGLGLRMLELLGPLWK